MSPEPARPTTGARRWGVRGRSSRSRWRRIRYGLAAPIRALRAIAHNRALLAVQLAWAAVMTASWAATVALAVVAYSAGGSEAVALAVLARTVPGALLGPALGALVDRISRRACMSWCAAVCSAAAAGAALAGASIAVVVVLMAVVALATMVFRAAQSAAMPELVDGPSGLVAGNTVSSSIESLGVFAGPALAGVLLTLQGSQLTFGVAAALFAIGAVLLVRGTGGAAAATRVRSSDRSSTRELLRARTAVLILGLLLAQTIVSGALVVLYPALAVDALSAGTGAVGSLTSAFGLGGLLGSAGLFSLVGSARLGLLTAWSLLLWAVPLLLVPVVPLILPVLVMLTVVGVGNVIFDVTSVTLLQRAVPARLLGRAFGTVETVAVIGLSLGAVLAPVIALAAGPAGALAILAAPLALVAVAVVRPLRRLDRELAAPLVQLGLLLRLRPFALLPALELERVALSLQRMEVAAGEVVVRQGEPGNNYLIIDHGTFTVTVDDRVVATLGPGEAFGEIALLRGGIRTATVTAREPATLWSLDGETFLAALRSDGGRALAAIDAVAQAHLQRSNAAVSGTDPEP